MSDPPDPSIYFQWVENAISKQLINYFDYREFSNHEKIGAGGFSTVVKAEWKSCELIVALKSIKFDTEMTEMKMFVKELQLLQRVSFHPKINHFYGVIKESDGNYKMVLQFANNGNLRDYLARKFSSLQWEDKFRIAREIAKGLEFIHANKIVHKDLHSKNILVHDDKMMIADFGLSKTVDIAGSNSNMEGMPAFIDPQCFKNSSYKRTTKSDIYSFGVILWEISSGHKPFPKLSRTQIAIQIFQDVRETPVGGTPLQYEQLYKQCWDVDPDKRPDIEEVFSLLNKLTIEPTEFRETIDKPLEGSLKKATLNHTIDSYNYHEFSEFTNIAEGPFSSVDEASFSASIARGMSAYIDPQCFRDPNHKRDKKSDTYSLGVILWEISSGKPPFKSIDIGFSITIHVFNGGREEPVEGTPPQYEQIYKQCWDDNPATRPDIAFVLGNLSQIIDA
ncbi:kinase-like protein [Gigaspora margarita]|uniref:Kinase-like protein n=1 Tax=Gigaspora margarita TaxID=4874 RepID=A0A8H4AJ49_GIGMA|nr:kinase-like protein [Gigaspora margarita]